MVETVVGKVCAKHPDGGGLRRKSGACHYCATEKNKRDNTAAAIRKAALTDGEREALKQRYLPAQAAGRKAWRERNKDKAALASKKWALANPHKVLAMNSEYRAQRRRATIGWDADLTKFVAAEAHDLARRREASTGFAWHVDHILPLKGKTVTGLHVWNNLRVIPAVVNRRKHNHIEVTP